MNGNSFSPAGGMFNVAGDTPQTQVPMRPPDQMGQPSPAAAAGGAPGVAGPPAARPMPPQVSPQVLAAQQEEAHHSLIGRMFRAVAGTERTYQVNPQSGQVESMPVQQKPGQMFRNLLAGALIGGAAGAEGRGQGGFMGAAGRGMTAQRQQMQQQDQQQYARAQQQFKNQLEARRETREETAAATEEQLKAAQIALTNKETLHQAFTTESAKRKFGLDMQKEIVENGKQSVNMWEGSGARIVHRDVLGTEVQKLPDYHKYQWSPSGLKVTTDPKTGEPYLETVYTGYDPGARVKLTPEMVKNYKDAGVDIGNLKPGSEISGEAGISLYQDWQAKHTQKVQQMAQDLSVGKMSAEVAHMRADTAHLLMETAKGKLDQKQSGLLDAALDELNKNGGDWNKLDPKSQAVIYQSNARIMADLSGAAKAAYAAGDTDEAKTALQQIGQLGNLIPKSFMQLPAPAKPGDPMPQDVMDQYLKTYGNVEAAKRAAAGKGWGMPAAAPPPAPAQQPPGTQVAPGGDTGLRGFGAFQ